MTSLFHPAKAKVCVADLSFHNPNAFYELDVRRAFLLPTIQTIHRSWKFNSICRSARFLPTGTPALVTIPWRSTCDAGRMIHRRTRVRISARSEEITSQAKTPNQTQIGHTMNRPVECMRTALDAKGQPVGIARNRRCATRPWIDDTSSRAIERQWLRRSPGLIALNQMFAPFIAKLVKQLHGIDPPECRLRRGAAAMVIRPACRSRP